jgi:hypothetical protein
VIRLTEVWRLDGLLVIATPEHTQASTARSPRMTRATLQVERAGRPVFLDAHDAAASSSIVAAHTRLFAGPGTMLSNGRGCG